MIGILSKNENVGIINEFFELFKTPWEYYQSSGTYNVIISTDGHIPKNDAKLIIIYGNEEITFKNKYSTKTKNHKRNALLEYGDICFPIYNKILSFSASKNILLKVSGSNTPIGIEFNEKNTKFIFIGFDLFQEINYLLSIGQPAEYAHIPTLEIHISILRSFILYSGVPLVEIPPIPFGYNYITCLTHDVDFIRIRNHIFDRTLLGFIYRALIVSFLSFVSCHISLKKLLQNWKALLLLPGVYLGLIKDYFNQFERYQEIEKGLESTFFIIPNKHTDGLNISDQIAKGRAVKYDIADIEKEINELTANGCEIALHGIDAWRDVEKGRKEFNKISNVTGQSNIGVRTHWLYHGEYSSQLLDDAGFYFDSTYGYNEIIGFRGGTTQVFRPPYVKKILELPLHIQDTALFYSSRMGLSENSARELTDKLFADLNRYGGVLVINWHQRSLGPERLWDTFYVGLVQKLKSHNVWFAKASNAVNWFNKRRSILFEKSSYSLNRMTIELSGNVPDSLPDIKLRIYRPSLENNINSPLFNTNNYSYIEIPIQDKSNFEISLTN